MAWKMSVNGVEVGFLIADVLHEQIKNFHKPGKTDDNGFWIEFGDQDAEGSQQIFIPAGAVILFTRSENQPQEANYAIGWPSDQPD